MHLPLMAAIHIAIDDVAIVTLYLLTNLYGALHYIHIP